jgi:geranylgeranyl pyrophosphate synthase
LKVTLLKATNVSHLENALLKSDLITLRDMVNAELLKLGSKIRCFGLCDQMNYAVLSYGKRLRPIMALLSTASIGGEMKETIDIGLALELIHTATLVHDDVLDNDATRRGTKTVHKKWSVGEAILAGDALLSLALSLSVNYSSAVLATFSETAMSLAEGEYLDLVSFRNFSEEDYLKRVERKSASLFRASTKCGALIGKGSEQEVVALSNYGEDFGMAYQIRDDIMDIIGSEEEEIPPDLKQQRMTLPIIHLMQNLTEQEQKDVLEKIENLVVKDDVHGENLVLLNPLLTLLYEKGSIEYCRNKVDFFVESALSALEPISETSFKMHLTEIAKSLKYTQPSKNEPQAKTLDKQKTW